jgi:alcohol dehydrogenase class IV
MALITYLTTARFGFGVLKELPDDLTALGIKRPLIVTDRGIAAAGLVERLFEVLSGDNRRLVFDDVPTNPTEEAALAALKIYREEECDGLIALGGGSPIDLAKAVALLATHPEPLSQYAMVEGGVARITPSVAPLIAIPTTSGTGSEVGRGSVMNLVDGRKVGVISPNLIPKRAICDPELTLGLPAWLTGRDRDGRALPLHRELLTPNLNPPAEGIGLDGARRHRAEPRARRAGRQDREARQELMAGAMEGGPHLSEGARRRSRALARAGLAEGAEACTTAP